MVQSKTTLRDAMRVMAQWGNSHPIVLAVLILVLTFCSALFIEAGAFDGEGVDVRLLAAGVVMFIVGVARTAMREAGSMASQHEAAQALVLSGDAHSPVLGQIAEMPSMTDNRSAQLSAVVQSALGAIKLLLPEIPRLRATVFSLDEHGMVAMPHHGRSTAPGRFERGTPRGDHALALVDERSSRRVDDVLLGHDLKHEHGPSPRVPVVRLRRDLQCPRSVRDALRGYT